MITQSVGLYPDRRAAQDALNRLAPSLAKCTELHDKLFDFTTRMARDNLGDLSGYAYPNSPSIELLRIGADLSQFAFAWDDQFCDEVDDRGILLSQLQESVFRLTRTVECPEIQLYPEDNYAEALRDISVRVMQVAGPGQYAAWVNADRDWFFIELVKAIKVVQKVRPRLDEYAVVRLHSGASQLFLVLAEVVNGIKSPPDIYRDRRIYAMYEMTQFAANWASDLYSHRKERDRTGDGYNAIQCLELEYGLSETDALELAERMCERVIYRSGKLGEIIVLEDGRPETRRYLSALEDYLVGCVKWSQITDRYRFVDGVEESALAFVMADFDESLSDKSDAPLPIPSMAWWWSLEGTTSFALDALMNAAVPPPCRK